MLDVVIPTDVVRVLFPQALYIFTLWSYARDVGADLSRFCMHMIGDTC